MEENRNMEQAESTDKTETDLATEKVTVQDTQPEEEAEANFGSDTEQTQEEVSGSQAYQAATNEGDASQPNADAKQTQPVNADTTTYQPDDTQPYTDTAQAQPANTQATKPKKSWKREAWEWIVAIAAALMVVFFCRNYLFQIIRVDGNSMYDTLQDNERLLVNVLDLRLHGVQRDDIVICHYPNRGNTNFVKRAVAVPGDTVVRINGVTHVLFEENGVLMDEPLDPRMWNYFLTFSSDDYEPYTLGEDEYFVVGDNRYNSHDSRDWRDGDPSSDVGPITEDMILGKVTRVIWPMDSARKVN